MKTCRNKHQCANRIKLSVKCRSLELNHYMPEFREDIIVYKHDVECKEIIGMTLFDRDVYELTE